MLLNFQNESVNKSNKGLDKTLPEEHARIFSFSMILIFFLNSGADKYDICNIDSGFC